MAEKTGTLERLLWRSSGMQVYHGPRLTGEPEYVRLRDVEADEARLLALQRGLSRLDPMQRSSMEGQWSCVFCGADKGHSYVTGDRTPHAPDCAWRLACEARRIPWDHVL